MTTKPPPPPDARPRREILFEIVAFGNVVKVIAVDAATGTEVSIQGPANAGEAALKNAALRKLDYVMSKKSK